MLTLASSDLKKNIYFLIINGVNNLRQGICFFDQRLWGSPIKQFLSFLLSHTDHDRINLSISNTHTQRLKDTHTHRHAQTQKQKH